ncbi:MAG: hypothetical protein IH886_15000 [Nitrospinae bacterium]|nr:hypothetical protein [Nitrospinota bacterium]
MAMDWKIDYNPDLVLEKLNKFRSFNEKGNVIFKNIMTAEHSSVILSGFNFNPEIPVSIRKRLVNKALASKKLKSLTKNGLKNEIRNFERTYLNQSFQKYALVCEVSLVGNFKSIIRRIDDCYVKFTQVLPNNLKRDDFLKLNKDYALWELPGGFSFATISLKARSEHEAAEKGLDVIDYLRGIWNLKINCGKSFRISSGNKPLPVNSIVLGPLHSVHDPEKRTVYDTFWVNDSYSYLSSNKNIFKDLNGFEKWEKKIKNALKSEWSGMFLKTALIRYSRALDNSDWDKAFLKMWTLLEYLTLTRPNENLKTTVKRVSSLLDDQELHIQTLNHLRNQRNLAVHASEELRELESLLFQLKRYVEFLIRFYVVNFSKFKNEDDLRYFLDLPGEKKELKSRISLTQTKLQYFLK